MLHSGINFFRNSNDFIDLLLKSKKFNVNSNPIRPNSNFSVLVRDDEIYISDKKINSKVILNKEYFIENDLCILFFYYGKEYEKIKYHLNISKNEWEGLDLEGLGDVNDFMIHFFN